MSIQSTIYSQHHFMFPFRWDILPKGFKLTDIKENVSFDNRTDLQNTIFENMGNWKRCKYNLKNELGEINAINYNEYIYFHEFVSKAVFDFEYPWKKNQHIIKYYEYDIDSNLKNEYVITYLDKVNKKDWSCNKYNSCDLILVVDGLTVHFFNTGVGVLTYNLSNRIESQSDKDSVLRINEFGRRMYPQFLGDNGVRLTQEKFLPLKIDLIINEQILASEKFEFYQHSSEISTVEPYRLPTYIRNLFCKNIIFRMDDYALEDNKILITKVDDDRMFFHCWYGDETQSALLNKDYEKNNWWYAYVFGDKDSNDISIGNAAMQHKQIQKHTYKRWADYGTLFGMTRDSFVCVADKKYVGFIRIHMNTMYYTLSVLCLAQRASILKFTAEVANLSDLAKIDADRKLISNIKDIYKNYIEFINKLYFREITSQIQGIELYNQFQKILHLENEIKDLDGEINELHEYVTLIQDNKRNEEAAKLNRLASIFIPATLMFGILGANFYNDKKFLSEFFSIKSWIWIFIGFIPSIIAYIYFNYKNKNND